MPREDAVSEHAVVGLQRPLIQRLEYCVYYNFVIYDSRGFYALGRDEFNIKRVVQ